MSNHTSNQDGKAERGWRLEVCRGHGKQVSVRRVWGMRTLRELAVQAGISHEAVRKAVRSGRLAAVRDESTGLRQLLVEDEEAERWLAGRQAGSRTRRDPSPAPTPALGASAPRAQEPDGATQDHDHDLMIRALGDTDWDRVVAVLGLDREVIARAVVDRVAEEIRQAG